MRFEQAKKPVSNRVLHCAEIGTQAVIARHLHHLALRRSPRYAEPISRSLHDKHRDRHRIELRETALGRRGPRPARRLQRKRKTDDSDGAHGFRSATGDTRARGSSTDYERQSVQLGCDQAVEHGRPRRIEVMLPRRLNPGEAAP